MNLFGKIPLTITPGFWVVAGLIGYLNTGHLIPSLIWIGVIFVSVLGHELGHASMAFRWGLSPRIELIAFGGVTHHFGKNLPILKQFLIVLAGPVFGLFLFFIASLINQYMAIENVYTSQFFLLLQAVNLFWTLFNLIPVLPLDGGQLLRLGLEAIFGPKGFSYALFFSVCLAVLGSLVFFFYQMLLVGSFFFLFAFQSYMDWKRVKNTLSEEVNGELQKRFLEAELFLQSGEKEKALKGFQEILKDSPRGLIYTLSSQYLAFLEYEKGEMALAYEILLPHRKKLTHEGLYLLYKTAFEVGDYPLVIDLSAACFQVFPVLETSLKAAKSHAMKGDVSQCIGWLQTSVELGLMLSKELFLEPFFNPIREDKSFSSWVQNHIC